METQMSRDITDKQAFENNKQFDTMQLSSIKRLAAMSNNSTNVNIEKIPRELWIIIFSALITPRYFKPLFVLACVCSEFLRILDAMLLTFFCNTTTSGVLLKKVNSMTPVTQLDLGFNEFICCCTLRKLTNLTNLDLANNSRIKSRNIRHLTNLVSLDITNNTNIANTALLLLANSLNSLNISFNTKIDNMTVRQLTLLTSLNISKNDIIDDTTIKQLTSLTSLESGNSSKVSDDSISCLTKLKVLNISGSKKVTDKSLLMLGSLTELNINETQLVTDFSIKTLSQLASLYMMSNKLITKDALKYLTNLERLNIADTGFTYKTIKHLTKIDTLNIQNTKVNTISSFTNLTTLYTNELISQEEIFHLPKISCLIIPNSFVFTDGSPRITLLQAKTSGLTDDILIKFSNLTALYLTDTSLITDNSLQQLTRLKILDLNIPGASITGSFLMQLQNLTALNTTRSPFFIGHSLNHPSLTHLSADCENNFKEKLENLGVIFYNSDDWWKKFSPVSSSVATLMSQLNLIN
jgi:Leucine-rich repeat (LRR) protein